MDFEDEELARALDSFFVPFSLRFLDLGGASFDTFLFLETVLLDFCFYFCLWSEDEESGFCCFLRDLLLFLRSLDLTFVLLLDLLSLFFYLSLDLDLDLLLDLDFDFDFEGIFTFLGELSLTSTSEISWLLKDTALYELGDSLLFFLIDFLEEVLTGTSP